MIWIILSSLLLVSVLVNLCLLYLLRIRHQHRWDDWSDWIQDIDFYNQVEAVRYRTCGHCAKVERQRAGWHKCHVIRMNHKTMACPHLDVLMDPGPKRIARLEKELGL